MSSKPKFLIFALLEMYSALSLKKLSKLTGKSKSTLSVHLSEMEDLGLVEVAYEEPSRGRIPTKYFKLVNDILDPDVDAHKKKDCCEGLELKERYRLFLETQKTFAQVQIQLLERWDKYLNQLQDDMDRVPNKEKDTDEDIARRETRAMAEIEELLKDKPKISIVSFYTEQAGQNFLEGVIPLYKQAEKENFAADKSGPVFHPYYSGVQILPIRRAIDYFLNN